MSVKQVRGPLIVHTTQLTVYLNNVVLSSTAAVQLLNQARLSRGCVVVAAHLPRPSLRCLTNGARSLGFTAFMSRIIDAYLGRTAQRPADLCRCQICTVNKPGSIGSQQRRAGGIATASGPDGTADQSRSYILSINILCLFESVGAHMRSDYLCHSLAPF